jgi:hypothetical protein
MKMTSITFCIKTETIFISPAKQALIERSFSITSLQSADRSGRQHVAEPLTELALLLSKNVSFNDSIIRRLTTHCFYLALKHTGPLVHFLAHQHIMNS